MAASSAACAIAAVVDGRLVALAGAWDLPGAVAAAAGIVAGRLTRPVAARASFELALTFAPTWQFSIPIESPPKKGKHRRGWSGSRSGEEGNHQHSQDVTLLPGGRAKSSRKLERCSRTLAWMGLTDFAGAKQLGSSRPSRAIGGLFAQCRESANMCWPSHRITQNPVDYTQP